ncbi:hypothetical protein FJU30_05015 [Affinibrenneria salicis]|uniref:Uncharacterized protein n=1 Tax=Affinibrenneria salicis TaxID=2590031 RepID=A0A5J5G5G6_9GAMM|nr:hypothetical protein [Affinibrenneria salicis]KAA9001656.1 hypothetical protein FJU30_05015 [Affinibrenneria salicis]
MTDTLPEFKNESDRVAYFLLKHFGYDVNIIPTSDKKEADFIIKLNGSSALVEAKMKFDDKNKENERDSVLSRGEVYVDLATLGRDRSIANVISDASKQLSSSAIDKPHNFKILLFIATGMNVSAKRDKIFDTLCGTTNIMEIGGGNHLKKCYFYRDSEFNKRKNEIDAAIIADIDNEIFSSFVIINPLSNNYDKLKESDFLSPFKNAIRDPFEEEKSGKAYILDEYIQKINCPSLVAYDDPRLRYLKKKYKTRLLMAIDFNAPEFSVRGE